MGPSTFFSKKNGGSSGGGGVGGGKWACLRLPLLIRGRLRPLLAILCAVTVVFALHRILLSDMQESRKGLHVEAEGSKPRRQGPKMFEDVNDLMPITQPREHLEQMRQHEAQMMHNVQRIIDHRLRESHQQKKAGGGGGGAINNNNNASGGGHAAPEMNVQTASKMGEKPSLWNGIVDDRGQREGPLEPHPHAIPLRFVHLDLKGAAPMLPYLKRLFPLLASLGATGILVEWEDSFPWSGRLAPARADDAYTESEVGEILSAAAANHLQVIPLIQTFGHLEFLLKLPEFRRLREVPSFPQAVCPSNNGTSSVLREMIDQVLRLHPGISHMHVGCDEVYNLGECVLCQERLEKASPSNWNKGAELLFLEHVALVARHVLEASGGRVRPLMWDDMLRGMTEESLAASGIAALVELVVWKYGPDVGKDIPGEVWRKYGQLWGGEKGVWIATAFKGASMPDSFVTHVQERLDNHRSWMRVVEEYGKGGGGREEEGLVHFKGVFLTGWQRYDHFAVLCELLPAGLPSLAVNLQFLIYLKYNQQVSSLVKGLLGCSHPPPLYPGGPPAVLFSSGPLSSPSTTTTTPSDGGAAASSGGGSADVFCSFPGSRLYELSLRQVVLLKDLEEQFFGSFIRGWATDYHVRRHISSPALIEQALLRHGDAVRNVSLFRMAASDALSDVYNVHTTSEWIEQNVQPILDRLDRWSFDVKKNLLDRTTWPKRPWDIFQEVNDPHPTTTTTAAPSNHGGGGGGGGGNSGGDGFREVRDP